MERAWLVIITKELRPENPPELYVSSVVLRREVARWRSMLGPSAAEIGEPDPLPLPSLVQLGDRLLHVVEVVFPDPWRACPIWVGVRWSRATYPRMRVRVVVADEGEAAEWFRRRARKTSVVTAESSFRLEAIFDQRGIETYVGIHRLKRVEGL